MALNSMDFHALARTAASGLLNSLLAGIGTGGARVGGLLELLVETVRRPGFWSGL